MSKLRILARVREALTERDRAPHPGSFRGWRRDPIPSFEAMFTAAGGEVARAESHKAAVDWMATFSQGFRTACGGLGLPVPLRGDLTEADPAEADVGISVALAAVAETGSLVLGAADGRRGQLLPPVHVVVVPADAVFRTLAEALQATRASFGSAGALHSGPSKSADIGQVLVRGVHGPGRLVALIVGPGPDSGPGPEASET